VYTFADPLEHALRVGADRVATVCGDVRHTFAELVGRCRRLGDVLDRLGVGRGERVAIWAGNSHQYVEIYAAVPAHGRVVVPLNTRHAEPELVYALEDAGAGLLLTDREPGKLADCVDRVIRIPDEWEALLAGADEAPLGEGVREDDLAGLFYTGGTTGASKGVMLSHRNLIANTFHWLAALPHAPTDSMLVMAPLFHAAGSNGVLANLWTTGKQVLLPTFDAAGALELIESEAVTGTIGVPTMLSAIAEEQAARPRRTDSMRWIAHGGSPIASALLRRVHEAIPSAELVEIYGATELSPLATIARHEEGMLDTPRVRSCGVPTVGVSVSILGEDGRSRPVGEVGEVVVRGPNVMQGYWNKPEQTQAVLRDGAYWTGDLGYVDDDGYLFLVDRSKDMIVSGGENVYSTEVEEVLYRHPAVLEAAVFGVPDERWGEAVHAAVHLRPGCEDVTAEALIAFCRESLGGYKVPRGIDLHADVLPKSGPGKFLKRQLRAPYWAGHDRAVN
jgi:acyl-CoA synthetase (AMP-forming)/AMP-acid ligase II